MQTFIEYPDPLGGLQRVAVDGPIENYEVLPFKSFPWVPGDWVCIVLKEAGNIYEGPGPARVFSE
jgi:hypothetical protein